MVMIAALIAVLVIFCVGWIVGFSFGLWFARQHRRPGFPILPVDSKSEGAGASGEDPKA